MISPQEAWTRIAREIEVLDSIRVRRRDASNLVLAKPMSATCDVPAADVSAMDGFALAKSPELEKPVRLSHTIAAGDESGGELEPGTAARIMTGAPTPERTDRIIPVEESRVTDAGVSFTDPGASGRHIRRRGEVIAAGQQLLPAGALLTPGALGLLATHGHEEVSVHRPPSLSILATGDEVVPPQREPAPGQLRDSHTDFLLAAASQVGSIPQSLGIAADRPNSIRRKVAAGLESDVLLVCGGVSMGEFDFVEEVLADLGCRVLFDAVAIQPGKPLVAARYSTGWVFGLPGNPASVMVGFWLFVRPLLRCLQGLADGYWQGALVGELCADLPAAKGRDRFLSARVRFENGLPKVYPLQARGSHDVVAYGQGTGLVRVAAHSPAAGPGDRCEFLPLVEWPVPIDPSTDTAPPTRS